MNFWVESSEILGATPTFEISDPVSYTCSMVKVDGTIPLWARKEIMSDQHGIKLCHLLSPNCTHHYLVALACAIELNLLRAGGTNSHPQLSFSGFSDPSQQKSKSPAKPSGSMGRTNPILCL